MSFTFNAVLFDLWLRSSEPVESATYGGRSYERLLQMEFESFNHETNRRERFILVCGTDGPLAGVPVYLRYQPKWCFRVECTLDETEAF